VSSTSTREAPTAPSIPGEATTDLGNSHDGTPTPQANESDQITATPSEFVGTGQDIAGIADDSGSMPVTCVNDESLRADFESLRQLLSSSQSHPLLNEELREFLEPEDTAPPIKFLEYSIREILDTPYERLAGSWVGRDRVECLLRMLRRAVTSIHSSEGGHDQGAYHDDGALRPRTNPTPRRLHVNEKSWRRWTRAIHMAGLRHLKLGTVVEYLRDLPYGLWDLPLSNFTTLSLDDIGRLPGVGPLRAEAVISAVRSLGVELEPLNLPTSLRLEFIPGPLRRTQDWIELVLEARLVPDVSDLVAQLVRPLACQLRHDLSERDSQIAIHRLHLDESPSRSTLVELAASYGLSRERIRQVEQWGPRVLQVRFPQGRYLLEALYGQLSSVPEAEPQAKLVLKLVKLCFESDIAPSLTSTEVSGAWEEAARLKLTPMTSEQILEWSRSHLPAYDPAAVLNAIRSQSPNLQLDGRPIQWFGRTELDRILLHLSQQRGPVRLAELILVDRIQNDTSVTVDDPNCDPNLEDHRNLWDRIRRDPRFVEWGEHHLLMPTEGCGFERVDGIWKICLLSRAASNTDAESKLSVAALARLIVDGLNRLGIADATLWGVHRFANEVVRKNFQLRLPASVTPHALADMLVKTSDGLIRPMRRRRLRWDEESVGIPARGKRGWVGYLVMECGKPMLLSELAFRLRENYQDYADYVVNQLTMIGDEDGETDDLAKFITGVSPQFPTVVLPTNWRDSSRVDDVTPAVANAIRQLAREIHFKRVILEELNAPDWLKTRVTAHLTTLQTFPNDKGPAPRRAVSGPAHRSPIGHQTRIATTPPLDPEALASLHSSSEARRVLSADLNLPIPDLIGYAFGRILKFAPTYRPWSLAELRLTGEDVDWLKSLLERTTAADLRAVLSAPSPFRDYSREAQFGSVLLLIESELARRYASERSLWAAIHRQLAWMPDFNRFLFTIGQPNTRHKTLLEAAARELRLRCAFGEDSAQEWYQSVLLQCGFSRKSFESRLPEWLIGQNLPVSVARLIGTDTRYASETFSKLWTSLREYRRGSLDRAGLKEVLESSPWVLQEWHESLVLLARANAGTSTNLGDQSGLPISVNDTSSPTDSTALLSERRFLSDPRMRLTDQSLNFVCNVEVTEGLELENDADILINGQVQSCLILQADGSFDATNSEIAIPTSSPKLIAELRARSGVTLATQELTLWDEDEDVAAFVIRTGRPIDPWSREFSQRETLLIYSADLRIEPARPTVVSLGNESRVGVRLLPQETINTRLFLGNELLWEPNVRSYPAWCDKVRASFELLPRESPTRFRVCVSHPSDVAATAVRFRRRLLDLTRDSTNRVCTDWLPLDAEFRKLEAVALTVFLRSGDVKAEVRRSIPLDIPGHQWRKGAFWEEVPSRATIELSDLRNAEFRLSPPKSAINGEQWQIFEGRRWIDSVKGRPQRITAVEGWGAPLILRAAPYNCCDPEQQLLYGLTDRGEIRDVVFSSDGAVTMWLHRPIEPGESHSVVLLDDGGETHILDWNALSGTLHYDAASASWTLPLTTQTQGRRIMALAIAYNGERLGSWWQEDWTNVLCQPTSDCEDDIASWASNLANSLRWFHVPLLSREDSPRLREFVKTFAVPVLSTWMTNHRLPQLVHEAVGEGWLSVVRALFSDWLPSVEEAQKLDKVLEPALSSGTDGRLMTTTLALADISSLLAIRFVRAVLKGTDFESAKIVEIRALLAAIRMRVLGRESEQELILRVARDVAGTDVPPEGTHDFVRDGLLTKCLNQIDVHESPHLTELDRCNIEVAMRLDAFRKLVIAAGLGRQIKELP
jgi:hypothetical protein